MFGRFIEVGRKNGLETDSVGEESIEMCASGTGTPVKPSRHSGY